MLPVTRGFSNDRNEHDAVGQRDSICHARLTGRGAALCLSALVACSSSDSGPSAAIEVQPAAGQPSPPGPTEPEPAPPSSSPEPREPSSQAAFALYFIEFSCSDMSATVLLNGVPLIDAEPNFSESGVKNITRWVTPGLSKLSLDLRRSDGDHAERAKFSARVLSAKSDQKPTEGGEIWKFRWPSADDDAEALVRSFEFQSTTPSLLWSKASKVALNDSTRQQLTAATKKLHSLFAAGDHEALAEQLRFRGEDLGRTEGTPPAQSVQEQRSFLETIMEPSAFEFEARSLGKEPLTMQLVGNDQVVLVRRGAEPALLSTEGQGLDLYFANVAGSWTVVR